MKINYTLMNVSTNEIYKKSFVEVSNVKDFHLEVAKKENLIYKSLFTYSDNELYYYLILDLYDYD